MDEDQNRLCDKNLCFFGTITASATHEINNVFSIINEFSGLLEDMTLSAEQGTPIPPEKLKRISQNIAKQITRGVSIIKRLNRFAHSIDEQVISFELNNFLEDTTNLFQRFARLKKISLVTNLQGESLTLTQNLFYLFQVLFIGIQLAINARPQDEKVTISYERGENSVSIVISNAPLDTSEEDVSTKVSMLTTLLQKLKGSMQIAHCENRDFFRFTIPNSIYS